MFFEKSLWKVDFFIRMYIMKIFLKKELKTILSIQNIYTRLFFSFFFVWYYLSTTIAKCCSSMGRFVRRLDVFVYLTLFILFLSSSFHYTTIYLTNTNNNNTWHKILLHYYYYTHHIYFISLKKKKIQELSEQERQDYRQEAEMNHTITQKRQKFTHE